MTPPPRLPPGEAHLWYAFLDSPSGQRLGELAWSLMSEAERARHDRFHFEKNRLEFRVTRALARTTLGRYLGAPPARLSFVLNEYGKPSVAPLDAPHDLRFNLSNTSNLVVCLLTHGVDVGVDVEPLDRIVDARGIASHYFSPREVADLFSLPDDRHGRRFLDYWTLKESYIKACGMGLAIPLAHFSFLLDPPRVGIAFAPERDDDPLAWQFEQLVLRDSHLCAVAFRKAPGGPDLRLLVREASLLDLAP